MIPHMRMIDSQAMILEFVLTCMGVCVCNLMNIFLFIELIA